MPQFLGTPVDDKFFDKALLHSLDITAPDHVQVLSSIKQGVVWVNVNGVCVLRCCRIRTPNFGDTLMFRDRSYP